MRLTTLICLVLLISGCKINILVPQGGTVQTASGLYACTEFESCVITVDHLFFSESFTAASRAGYRFVGWETGQGYFCGGNRQACDLNTLSFAGNANLLDLLDSSREFFLYPVFQQLQFEPSLQPDIPVFSEHRQINYPVTGNTPEQVFDAFGSASNPLAFDAAGGVHTIAQAQMQYQVLFQYTLDGSSCRFFDYELLPVYETIMPQLVDLDVKPAQFRNEWLDFYGRMLKHEIGHQKIYRDNMPLLLQSLRDLPESRTASGQFDCERKLVAELDEVLAAVNEHTAALQDEYHSVVGTSVDWDSTVASGASPTSVSVAGLSVSPPVRMTFRPQAVIR